MLIKIDSAILLDTFGLLRNMVSSILFVYLKFNIYKDEYGINVVNIDINDINKKTGINIKKINNGLNSLIKNKFILNKENNVYYMFNESEYFDNLRKIQREKFYTRGVVFNIKKSFFYKFLKKINNNFLAFRLYYFLLLITQHDLWPNQLQVRSKIPMTETVKLARVWCVEDIFFKNLSLLIEAGLVIVDQKHKIHTLIKFVV